MLGMQTRHRLSAVLAFLSLATALIAGCSSGSNQSSAPLPDATTLVKQSADASKNVKSAHLVLTVNGKFPGLPLKSLTGDLTTTPSTAAKGSALITLGSADDNADFVVLDGELYSNALPPHNWSDFGKATEIINYDPSAILNPDTGLANLLANFTNAKAEGRDTIGGQTTIRISGNVSADALNKIAPPFKATAPMPATVWIQETGDHQLVQANLEKSSGISVQMTMSNWNQQVQITKPPVS
jgi:lipoprotein LprG